MVIDTNQAKFGNKIQNMGIELLHISGPGCCATFKMEKENIDETNLNKALQILHNSKQNILSNHS